MREILFRGKRIDNSEWTFGGIYQQREDDVKQEGVYIIGGSLYDVGCAYAVIRDTVGQYIGFVDKNSKKIFEGDIVLCPVFRHGSGINWYNESNEYHGFGKFFAPATVIWHDVGGWVLKENAETKAVIDEIRRPHGNERRYQEASIPHGRIDKRTASLCEIIGSIYDKEE